MLQNHGVHDNIYRNRCIKMTLGILSYSMFVSSITRRMTWKYHSVFEEILISSINIRTIYIQYTSQAVSEIRYASETNINIYDSRWNAVCNIVCGSPTMVLFGTMCICTNLKLETALKMSKKVLSLEFSRPKYPDKSGDFIRSVSIEWLYESWNQYVRNG